VLGGRVAVAGLIGPTKAEEVTQGEEKGEVGVIIAGQQWHRLPV